MRPLTALLFLLALVVLAPCALAAEFAPPAPPASVVTPGSEVVTALPALPEGAYEFELFVVPEHGAPIRVSAELPADSRVVRWRMPAIAARHARLVLRAGGEHVEWESAPSAMFELAPLPAGELDRLRTGRSEAGVRLESCIGTDGADMRPATPGATLSPGDVPAYEAEDPPPSLVAPGEHAGSPSTASAPATRARFVHRPRVNTPAFTPLRN